MAKSSHLYLLGLLTTGLALASTNAHGQLNMEYQQQISKEQQCKLDWWPNAQYEYKSISRDKERRILVKGNDVFLISYKGKCSSEFIGYVGSDYVYSPSKIRHFSVKPEKLVEYYKHPQQVAVRTKEYMPLKHRQSYREGSKIRRDW